jgi:centrosomal protein CEP104
MITFEPQTRTWECARYAKFPQEIVIRLNYRSEIAHIILISKEERFIPEVEI